MNGIVLRRGHYWSKRSIEWARIRLRYGGELYLLHQAEDLEIWGQGEIKIWEADDGSRIFGCPARGLENVSAEAIFSGGAFAPELPAKQPSHQFVAVHSDGSHAEMILGWSYPLGCFYRREGVDVFVAPEIKAFSNIRRLKRIRPFPCGHRMRVGFKGEAGDPKPADDPPAEALPALPYEEAVRQCRELLERSLDRTLSLIGSSGALALSGGIDSSILAYMLAARGVRLPAFNVWFDRGQAEAPLDVRYARQLAAELKLELIEVRVTADRLLALLPDAIYYGEGEQDILIDNGLFHLPLLQAMRERGCDVRIAANGIDVMFGGFEHYATRMEPEAFRALYLRLLGEPQARHIDAFHDLAGVLSLTPFDNIDVLEFALKLPQEYMAHFVGDRFFGKRIIRDAFRGDVPDRILDRKKGLPGETNDASRMTEELFGGAEAKRRAYERLRGVLLSPPNLRFIPGWMIRAGWLEAAHRRRLRKAMRLL